MILALLILDSILLLGVLWILTRQKLLLQLKENHIDQLKEIQDLKLSFQQQMFHFFEKNKEQSYDLREQFEVEFAKVRQSMESQVSLMIQNNQDKLSQIQHIVDEKLQRTLNERLSESFASVSQHLLAVQNGLGEMRHLAQDVGGLKKVLTNVKIRGSLGEVQLQMLLEQILAPEQFAANVKTKLHSADLVEFAVKLPGHGKPNEIVWLPIDAKFPKDIYEKLQDAYEEGDITQVQLAQVQLEKTIKKMAKDIRDKYIDPPHTTDFAILFLPFEGIYGEVTRKAALLEQLQKEFKIIVTGPTTLAALLNSLQMGFKTLAIQQRSGEVWQVLGEVKKEFELFGGLLGKAHKNIQTGLSQMDDLLGTRTGAIQRKLRNVEKLQFDHETNVTNLATSTDK